MRRTHTRCRIPTGVKIKRRSLTASSTKAANATDEVNAKSILPLGGVELLSGASAPSVNAHLLWLVLRSLDTEVVGLCVTIITQLSEGSLSGFTAFLVSSVGSPHRDWDGMQHHYEIENHPRTSGFATVED